MPPMLMVLTFGSYAASSVMALGLLFSRIRLGNFAGQGTDRVSRAALLLGGTGEISSSGHIALHGPDRVFSLTGCEWTKQKPQLLHLGTTIRAGVRTVAAAGSAFRQAGDEQPLQRLPHVVFRREGAVSTLTKLLRLNVEVQSGDRSFDDAVYIEHDGDRAIVARLVQDAELRAAIREAIGGGAEVVLNEEGHGVALRWVTGTAPDAPERLNAAGQLLGRMADRLPAVENGTLDPRSKQWKRGLWTAAPIVLAAPGIIFGAFLQDRLGPVDTGFGTVALVACSVAFVLAFALAWMRLRGRTAALRRMYLALNVAVALLPTLIASGLAVANGAGVDARATHHTTVVSSRSSKSKSGHLTCYAELAPWREGLSKVEATVPCGRAMNEGTPVTARVGVGRLGWEWVEKVSLP